MGEILELIFNSYYEYNGTGMYMALFFVAFLIMYLKKGETNKIMLSYTVVLLLLVFNPFVVNNLVTFFMDKESFITVFWLFPVIIMIAYMSAEIIYMHKGKKTELGVIVAILALIILSGQFVYSKELSIRADNKYKIPEDALTAFQALEKDSENPKIIVPKELLPLTRKYSGSIRLMYGTDVTDGNYQYGSDPVANYAYQLYYYMQEDPLPLGEIVFGSRMAGCNYIIFDEDFEQEEEIVTHGFEVLVDTGTYVVYKDMSLE